MFTVYDTSNTSPDRRAMINRTATPAHGRKVSHDLRTFLSALYRLQYHSLYQTDPTLNQPPLKTFFYGSR